MRRQHKLQVYTAGDVTTITVRSSTVAGATGRLVVVVGSATHRAYGFSFVRGFVVAWREERGERPGGVDVDRLPPPRHAVLFPTLTTRPAVSSHTHNNNITHTYIIYIYTRITAAASLSPPPDPKTPPSRVAPPSPLLQCCIATHGARSPLADRNRTLTSSSKRGFPARIYISYEPRPPPPRFHGDVIGRRYI